MPIWWAVAIAVLGNCFIGIGQIIQKWSILKKNEIRDGTLFPVKDFCGYSASGSPVPPYTRWWLLGICMSYSGEVLANGVGLAFAPAGIISPLGMISVLVNVVAARWWLGEPMKSQQLRGYFVIFCGVSCLLTVALVSQATVVLVPDVAGLLSVLNRFSWAFASLISIAVIIAFLILIQVNENILSFVVSAACFASVTLLSTKFLSLLLRHLSSSSTDTSHPNSYSAEASSSPLPSIHLTEDKITYSTESETTHTAPIQYYVTFSIFLLVIVLVTCTLLQEFVKQSAIRRFPVSKFQPLLYAAINGISTLSSVWVFKEIPDGHPMQWIFFLIGFSFAFVLLWIGADLLARSQGDLHSLDTPPPKRNKLI